MIKKLLKLIDLIGSTEGEDKIILAHADGFKGTYLDIGCSNPIKDSNTFRLYMAGWKGTCIDIRKIRRFKWFRPRDFFFQGTITDISIFLDFDLLSIDVDGIDYEILKTMAHRPRWIIAETSMPSQKPIPEYLTSLGYKIIGQTSRNHIFELKETKWNTDLLENHPDWVKKWIPENRVPNPENGVPKTEMKG